MTSVLGFWLTLGSILLAGSPSYYASVAPVALSVSNSVVRERRRALRGHHYRLHGLPRRRRRTGRTDLHPPGFRRIPVAVGVAILRHRLYDVDLVINRTLVYGPFTATLVALYFGGIVVLQRVFVALRWPAIHARRRSFHSS